MNGNDIHNSVQPFGQRIELDLCFFGNQVCEPGHFWGPGIRQHYIFHYVHSGKGIMRIGDQIYNINQGQGFLICPDTIIYYKADDDDPWTYTWVGFQGLYAKAYLERAQLSRTKPIFYTHGNLWFEGFLDEMVKAKNIERNSDVGLQSIMYRFFAELILTAPELKEVPTPAHTKEAYIRKAIEYLEIHYSQKISVLNIAQFVGLDRTYLSSLFKEKLGLSLQIYLLQFRMNRAKELLLNQDLTIGDISRSVGYTDPLLFSKMFKKINRVSPKAYRESPDVPVID
ncbi:AraC family transcriptional regulator [Paenibacillus psychroresistens]|uniref:AraC family transcriptional regulator n=1 Tax=Paenibacillus psychroresistens TaxID=1778678 RepID=A0A6B8RNX8_9BACL|nr:AraC family transcriptional regulator [Paenibacillus psychroresistens]QGQ98040.1 AraC family transcriptional regulator [Paenibacillus psychroresistens]